MEIRHFDQVNDMLVDPENTGLPEWLVAGDLAPVQPSSEKRALAITQFEVAFPRTLELIASGYTFTSAVKELPVELDVGAFLRWIKKEHSRNELYKEAKELRSEAWAGKLVEYAEGCDSIEDVQRSKLKVDTLKWLMAADNRRQYGDIKQVELGGTISIKQALEEANNRIIEAEVIEILPNQRIEGED